MGNYHRKTGPGHAFDSLNPRKQKAIVMLFEDTMTDEEIAKAVGRNRSTLSSWKNTPDFQAAQREYRDYTLDSYVPAAIKQLGNLLHAKSEMVQLQSSTTILSMAGYSTNGDNPKKIKQEIRKLKADADIAEAHAKRETDEKSDGALTINIVRHDEGTGGADASD